MGWFVDFLTASAGVVRLVSQLLANRWDKDNYNI